jgi:hypothetical protein
MNVIARQLGHAERAPMYAPFNHAKPALVVKPMRVEGS